MLEKELDLLEELFDADEMRSRQQILEHYQNGKCQIDTTYDLDEIESIILYRDLNEFLFIEYFGINPKFQGQKRGSKVLKDFMDRNNKDVILEVEKIDNELKQRRVNFYERLGYHYHNDDYFMYSFKDGKTKVPLKLMSYPNSIESRKIANIIKKIHNEVYENVDK